MACKWFWMFCGAVFFVLPCSSFTWVRWSTFSSQPSFYFLFAADQISIRSESRSDRDHFSLCMYFRDSSYIVSRTTSTFQCVQYVTLPVYLTLKTDFTIDRTCHLLRNWWTKMMTNSCSSYRVNGSFDFTLCNSSLPPSIIFSPSHPPHQHITSVFPVNSTSPTHRRRVVNILLICYQ